MSTADPHVRLTVVGRVRSADVVLPTDQPPAALLPELLDLLTEPGEAVRLRLYTDVGHELSSHEPLAEQGLRDGQRVRIAPVTDAPAEPVVHDLVDRISGADVTGLWTPTSARWVTAVLASALVLVAAWLHDDPPGLLPWIALGGLVGAVVAHALAARAVAWCLSVVAAVLGITALVTTGSRGAALAVAVVGLATAGLLLAGMLTRHLRAAVTAVIALLALAGVAWLSRALGADPVQTAGVVGVVTLLLLGLLPRVSMIGSGLYAVDDRIVDGAEVQVRSVEATVAEAYAALTLTVVVTCTVLGCALWVLGAAAVDGGWIAVLGGLLALGAVVRARHFPMAAHRLAIWGAAIAGGVALGAEIARSDPASAFWVAAACVVVAAGLLGVPLLPRGSDVWAAQGRRAASAVERVCVLASLPVLIGAFGVYADLLGTF
ncbi:hypothetical protein BJF80_03240 [Serinicoccus sp. CUA-874]|uniref:EsaB/YukD family protein n=1 Tax=Serinicoccus sp. CUA-874 TaxID=1517939 RepID=UPI00095CDACB|nr:EsaB/YukD family protein [Serinicoccus sp. CUA-874]OLT17200.1 hypothetical protein BJF80_03240 [Serinicoccus sp. CUA-874]